MQISVTGRGLPGHANVMADARREAWVAALLAACFGAALILGVGFLQTQAVHDAAHDTRHAVGFPCH
jgi:cobalt transporter subunit CbtB